jgi:hypothetical protein
MSNETRPTLTLHRDPATPRRAVLLPEGQRKRTRDVITGTAAHSELDAGGDSEEARIAATIRELREQRAEIETAKRAWADRERAFMIECAESASRYQRKDRRAAWMAEQMESIERVIACRTEERTVAREMAPEWAQEMVKEQGPTVWIQPSRRWQDAAHLFAVGTDGVIIVDAHIAGPPDAVARAAIALERAAFHLIDEAAATRPLTLV